MFVKLYNECIYVINFVELLFHYFIPTLYPLLNSLKTWYKIQNIFLALHVIMAYHHCSDLNLYSGKCKDCKQIIESPRYKSRLF
jgi:hypothetical protein